MHHYIKALEWFFKLKKLRQSLCETQTASNYIIEVNIYIFFKMYVVITTHS